MYNYSIIIPHKNIPDLLERCLASIPRRDDVQIIVVDDSSEERLVDFSRFPGMGRPHTEVIFHKSPIGGVGGAGMARNVGLDVARGRWLVFADADDFFHPDISDAFDRYADSDADMICFRHDSVDSATLEPVAINTRRNRGLEEMDRTGSEEAVRYMTGVPWARFIERRLVEEHEIRFDETRFSNNLMFTVRTGYFAGEIVSDPAVVYCNVRRRGSLIHEGRKDWAAMSERFDVDYRVAVFLESVGQKGLYCDVVARRWKELSLLHRRRAKKLLPKLREVCPAGMIRSARFEENLRRLMSIFVARHRKRNILKKR